MSACSWMTHLINSGCSKVDNEAMQLLKSILPDKIIARIQGVSWRQQASKHTREPAVTLTHLQEAFNAHLQWCPHACHNDLAFQSPMEGPTLTALCRARSSLLTHTSV